MKSNITKMHGQQHIKKLYSEPQMVEVRKSCRNLLGEPSCLASICKHRRNGVLKSKYAYVCTLNSTSHNPLFVRVFFTTTTTVKISRSV